MSDKSDYQDLTPDDLAGDYEPRIEYVTLPHPRPKETRLVRVKFKSVGADVVQKIAESIYDNKGRKVAWRDDNFRSIVALHCMVNEQGERLFPDDSIVRSRFWKEAKPAFLNGVLAAARRVCGDLDLSLEDDIKNSEATDDSASPCESPVGSEDGTTPA